MRLFILNDTTLPFNLIEIERIELFDDKINVNIAKWENLDIYAKHGNEYQPIERETLTFECDYLIFDNLLDQVYNMVGNTLPPHTVILHKPHE